MPQLDAIANPPSRATGRAWALSFLIAFAILAALWAPILRNDGTPSGDGARVMKFVRFMQDAGGGFALWDPYRNGGSPVMANPEQFWIQSLLIDANSPTANLRLNLLLYAHVLMAVPLIWLFAVRVGLSPLWAGVATVLIGFSDWSMALEQSAQFGALINESAFFLVCCVAIKERLRPLDITLLIIGVALAIMMGIQYALLHGLVILSAFLFGSAEGWARPMHHVAKSALRALAIGLSALAISAVIVVPAIGHHANSHLDALAIEYEANVPKTIAELARLLVPYLGVWHIWLPLLVVPALLLGKWGWPDRARSLIGHMALPLALALLFVVMALPGIGQLIQLGYREIPMLSSLRQFSVAGFVLTVVATLVAALVFQHHAQARIAAVTVPLRQLAGVFFGVCAVASGAFAVRSMDVTTFAAAASLAAMAAYALASSVPRYRLARVEAARIESLGLLLAGLSVLMMAAQPWWDRDPTTDRVLHQDNKPELATLHEAILADPTPYFRVWKDTRILTFIEAARRGGIGFSLHYPSGLAYSLKYLSASYDISPQRPHWIPPVRCPEYDPRALDLLAIRYLLCWKPSLKDYRPPGFEAVGDQDRMVMLKRSGTAPLLHVFCRARQAAPVTADHARETVLEAFQRREMLLEGAREIMADAACPPGDFAKADVSVLEDRPDLMRLQVKTEQAGYLLIPDNFDPGWIATVDGEPAAITRAYFAYRAIAVGRGDKAVTLSFEDYFVRIGAAISLASLAGLVLVTALVLGWRQSRRGTP